jgi:hypothetical protein
MDFSEWYNTLSSIAQHHGVSVADRDAWRECFDQDQTPHDAFYDEYPEFL